MAYEGFLIQVGTYKIPLKYINAEEYTVTLTGQDVDSYNDANGNLQRTAMNNFVPAVEFSTPPLLTDSEIGELFSNIRSQFINPVERKLPAKIFIPELNDYVEQNVYMADTQFTIYGIFDGVVRYNSVSLTFTGYGGTSF